MSIYPIFPVQPVLLGIEITLVDEENFFSHTKILAKKCKRMIESEHHVVTPNEIIDSGNNH